MKTKTGQINGLKFEYYENDGMATGIFEKENGVWEPHILNFVREYNQRYKIKNIIDIGGNFGYHTLHFAREIGPNGGIVYTFEPQPQNFALLKKNAVLNNYKNIVLYNNACGTKKELVKIPIMEPSKIYNMGDITPNYETNRYSTYVYEQSIALDSLFLPDIDLIKIDVQGWEPQVITGSLKLLHKYKPVLIVEIEEIQLQKAGLTSGYMFKCLRDHGYKIYFLEYSYPSDHICIHQDKVDEFETRFKSFLFPHTENNSVNNNIGFQVDRKIVIP